MVARSVKRVRVRRFLPLAAATVALTMAAASGAGTAAARGWHVFHRHAYSRHVAHAARVGLGSVAPNFSAIVIDANTGRTLYNVNADAPRHPASITKVMTLYLLFEQMEKGKIGLDTPLMVSAHAAAQSPTKLGVPAGSTISVDDAIKAIVTRSANDMAVAVAENLAGDEVTFARLMTEKAHALGMTHTFYHNASGLPDMRQITTARDLTILGRAIHDRFPRYYRFFSTPSFVYHGQTITSHNHLMARMEGMDGIKTGYTNASGFNLLSSVSRGGRHVVAVVMGGKSAAGRDTIMQGLLESHFEEASATPATEVADRSPVEEPAETPRRAAPEPPMVERPAPTPAPADVAQTDEDDEGEDGAPVEKPTPPRGPSLIAPQMAVPLPPVEHVRVAARPELPKVAPRPPGDRPRPAFIPGARSVDTGRLPGPPSGGGRGRIAVDGSTNRRIVLASAGDTPIPTATPSSLHWVTGPQPVRLGPSAPDSEPKIGAGSRAAPISFGGKPADLEAGKTAPAPRDDGRPAVAKGDWVIQIGATDNAGAAADLLNRARSEGRSALASARPFTEKVQKGDATLYRARFAGLDPAEAETACRTLKRSGFACFATRN